LVLITPFQSGLCGRLSVPMRHYRISTLMMRNYSTRYTEIPATGRKMDATTFVLRAVQRRLRYSRIWCRVDQSVNKPPPSWKMGGFITTMTEGDKIKWWGFTLAWTSMLPVLFLTLWFIYKHLDIQPAHTNTTVRLCCR